MKCVAIKDVKKFEIKDILEPVADGESVLIDVKKTGICGSDIHYWVAGEPAGLVMGHEFCGVVTDPGNRSDLRAGDRVTALPISPCGNCPACLTGNPQYCPETWSNAVGLSLTCPGGLAPKIKVRSDMVIKVPDTVSDEEAAMVEPASVGLHSVHLANIKVGERVLVIGAGNIGIVTSMIANMEGASSVVISEPNKERGLKAVRLGVADSWYDAKDTKMIETLKVETKGGFDVVIDCCGNSPAVTTALATVRPGGRVVLAGVSLGTVTIPTVVAVMNEVTVQGSIGYTKEEFETTLKLIETKKIDVNKFVDDIVGLEEVQRSYERLTSGNDSAVKILVDPNK